MLHLRKPTIRHAEATVQQNQVHCSEVNLTEPSNLQVCSLKTLHNLEQFNFAITQDPETTGETGEPEGGGDETAGRTHQGPRDQARS